jgi:hypothetical protein
MAESLLRRFSLQQLTDVQASVTKVYEECIVRCSRY